MNRTEKHKQMIFDLLKANEGEEFSTAEIAEVLELHPQRVKQLIGGMGAVNYFQKRISDTRHGTHLYKWVDGCREMRDGKAANPYEQSYKRGMKVWRFGPGNLTYASPEAIDRLCREHEPCEVY